jgi:hypothetical protein
VGESERFTVKPLIISHIGIYGMHNQNVLRAAARSADVEQ